MLGPRLRQLPPPFKPRSRWHPNLLASFTSSATPPLPAFAYARDAYEEVEEVDEDAAERYPTWDEMGTEHLGGEEGLLPQLQPLEGQREVPEEYVELLERPPRRQEQGVPWETREDKKVRREKGVSSRPARAPVPPAPAQKLVQPGAVDPSLFDSPIQPYVPPKASTSTLPKQPHDYPLLSRSDWRLSSPLFPIPARSRSTPEHLAKARDLKRQGHNLLVGVGMQPAAEAARFQGTRDERWGWRLSVPEEEKGGWPSCDVYRKG